MLNYCIVKQRIGAIAQDDPNDTDRYPNYRTVSGDVTFTPIIPQGKAYQIVDSEGIVHTVPALRITAKIVNGEIAHEGESGVHLFAAGANSNPPTIAYNVVYSNLNADGIPVTLNGISFIATPGGTIDLSSVTPITGTPGIGITKGDKGDPFTYADFTEDQLEDLIQQIRDEVLASIGGTIPDPVDPDPDPVDPNPVDPVDPVDPEPEPTEVEAPAPSWTDNSDGGGIWTTPVVEGIEYNPASGTAKPGQIVTVTATALDGYVLLGATGWTHRFPVAPGPVEYSFAIRADTAPVNDRKQIYALTAEKWAALSYLRDKTASHADPLGALNVALRSDAAKIIGVTSVTERALVEDGETKLGQVRSMWLNMASYRTPAYTTFVADIGPVIDEISTKGVLI